jgi:hypothetical protein
MERLEVAAMSADNIDDIDDIDLRPDPFLAHWRSNFGILTGPGSLRNRL